MRRRIAAGHVLQSERDACQLENQQHGTQCYQATQCNDEDALTWTITALAAQEGRFGHRRMTVKVREAGWLYRSSILFPALIGGIFSCGGSSIARYGGCNCAYCGSAKKIELNLRVNPRDLRETSRRREPGPLPAAEWA